MNQINNPFLSLMLLIISSGCVYGMFYVTHEYNGEWFEPPTILVGTVLAIGTLMGSIIALIPKYEL